MTVQKDELRINIPKEDSSDALLTGVSIDEVSLTDDDIEEGLSISINQDEDSDESETIIDSFINSLTDEKQVSLTDVAIEQLGVEGNKANILAAGLQIDISSGEKFDADTMVKDRIDMESNVSQQVISDIDSDNFIDDPTVIQPTFTKRELDGLAQIVANTKGHDKIRELKTSVMSINSQLRKNIEDEADIHQKYSILKPHVLSLGEHRKLLVGALEDLQGFDAGRDTSATLRPKVRQGISALHVQDELKNVDLEIDKAQKSFLELKSREEVLVAEQGELIAERNKLQKQIQQVMGNLDIQSSLTEVTELYSKAVAIEFGNKKLSKEFKETPVFIKCQCGCVSKFDYGVMPRYVGIKITQYQEYKTKLQSYSREKMNNLTFRGLTDSSEPNIICEGCKRPMMFSPTIIEDFVKSAFAREVHAIEKHSKSNSTANTPEDYQDSAVYYLLSESNFPSEYLRDLGFMKYYESKVSTINTDPLADIESALPMTEKEERIVRMFNPDVPEEMLSASMKSFNNLITSVNVFLDTVHKDKLKIKRNATSKSAMEKNKVNRMMSNFIVEQRWLLVSYCVNKQLPIQVFKERLDNAYKSAQSIRKFQYELFDFFVEHVVESIVNGRDIVYVDTNRNTKLLEVQKRQLPHQVFFNRYKKLITVYFKIRSKQIKSLAQLEVFQNVLSGVVEITKIESEAKAFEKSEEVVRNVLKDIDDLIENGLTTNFDLRQQLIVLYGKTTEKVVNHLIANNQAQYEEGNFYAWVAYEAKNNLLNPKTIATNEELYSKLYGSN